MLVRSRFQHAKDLLRRYPQFVNAPSEIFAAPVQGGKESEECRFGERQVFSQCGEPMCLGLAPTVHGQLPPPPHTHTQDFQSRIKPILSIAPIKHTQLLKLSFNTRKKNVAKLRNKENGKFTHHVTIHVPVCSTISKHATGTAKRFWAQNMPLCFTFIARNVRH